MKTLMTKAASAVSGVVLFCLGAAIAGLGLGVVALLAVFALAVAGVALLAAPFVALANPVAPAEQDASQAQAAA